MSNITRDSTPILRALERDQCIDPSNPAEIRARKNDTLDTGKKIPYRAVSNMGGFKGWLTATFSFASRRETALNVRKEINEAFGKEGVASFNKQFKGNVWGFKPITDHSLKEFVKAQRLLAAIQKGKILLTRAKSTVKWTISDKITEDPNLSMASAIKQYRDSATPDRKLEQQIVSSLKETPDFENVFGKDATKKLIQDYPDSSNRRKAIGQLIERSLAQVEST